jgi:UDP-glucose 4-epimerase
MEKYFITGAMGFIGSHLCEHLLKKGKTVYGLDVECRYPRLLEFSNFIFIQDTIKNESVLAEYVEKADCVCHLAAVAEPDKYVQHPRAVMDITAVAGIRLIEISRRYNKLFFFTSSSEIYGKNSRVPFGEDDERVLGSTMTKRWCYSTSKALLEHYLDACSLENGFKYITVRLFNVYGPRLRGRVVSNFLEHGLTDGNISVHGDGHQTRSFTYIDDVVNAFCCLIENEKAYNQVFNVGYPRETSIYELAQVVQKVLPSHIQINYIRHRDYYGTSYEDISRRIPDINKIQNCVGWYPETTLEEGLKKTVRYMLNGDGDRKQ